MKVKLLMFAIVNNIYRRYSCHSFTSHVEGRASLSSTNVSKLDGLSYKITTFPYSWLYYFLISSRILFYDLVRFYVYLLT